MLQEFASGSGELHAARRGVRYEMRIGHQRCRQRPRGMQVRRRWAGYRLRQNQRHACLIDQDAVGLVDDRHAQAAQQTRCGCGYRERSSVLLRHAASGRTDAVTQIVEHQRLGGAIGDVAGVSGAPRGQCHGLIDCAYCQAQRAVQRQQLARIARHQIIIGGNHVHRTAGECGCRRGDGGGQGFAFAGGHFRQMAIEHDARGSELHVERCHGQFALTDNADDGEGFDLRGLAQAVARELRAQSRDARGELLRHFTHDAALARAHGSDKWRVIAARRGSQCAQYTRHHRRRIVVAFRMAAQQQAGGGDTGGFHGALPAGAKLSRQIFE